MGFLDVLDARLGDGLENVLCSHHARRLRRLGWGEVLDGEGTGWFTPRRTVQPSNKIEVLIDGASAFPVVAQAIEEAQKYVHIANWHASPDFQLTREPGAPQLRELLSARALRSAQSLIYLENQFLWSPEITEVLIEKLRRPPTPEFRMVLLLPQKPSNGADSTRGQLGRLLDADSDGRLVAATLVAHGDAPVYVHANLTIVDDEWLSVGSANLNEHSPFNDTEVNVVTDDAAVARMTRLRLWTEHLGTDVSGPVDEVVDRVWRPAVEGRSRATSLPGVSRRAGRLQGPLRGLLVDG